MIEMTCPHCGQQLRIEEKFRGQTGVCNQCRGAIQVPPDLAVSRDSASDWLTRTVWALFAAECFAICMVKHPAPLALIFLSLTVCIAVLSYRRGSNIFETLLLSFAVFFFSPVVVPVYLLRAQALEKGQPFSKGRTAATGCGAFFLFFFLSSMGLGVAMRNPGLTGQKTNTAPIMDNPSGDTSPEIPKDPERGKPLSADVAKGATPATIRQEGDIVHVGYTSYVVSGSWWSNTLSANQYLDQPPNAAYLFVQLTVRNNDKKARMVPPLVLNDENGAEYEASSKSWAVEGAIGILESLNPDVSKEGFVIFDVPMGRKYKLKLSGGYWSAEDAFVQLAPKSNE